MKYSGVEWIGNIPDKWNLVRLKDICINKKEVAGEKSSEYERLALTLNGVIKRPKDDQEGLQPKEFDTYQILEENDFVFKMIDLQNISTSRVGLSPYTGLVSPAYIRFASKKKGQFNEFIHYYLLSLWHNCVYNNIAGDGVRSALNATDMGNLMCPYPTEDQQRKIAGFLNKKTAEIDSLIEIENQQIEKLKEYKQAVITEAVTRGLDKDAPLKDSGVEWIGLIPKEWNICRFKNVITIANGKEIEVDGGEIPVYGSGGIFKYTNKPLFTGLSLLLGRKGTIDKPMLVSGSFWTVDTMFYTSEIRNIDEKFLFYCAKTLINFDFYKSGSVLPSMTQIELNNIYITYPDIKTQKEIAVFLDNKCAEIDALISIKQNKIDDLNEYKKSLIYEYVTGKKEAH